MSALESIGPELPAPRGLILPECALADLGKFFIFGDLIAKRTFHRVVLLGHGRLQRTAATPSRSSRRSRSRHTPGPSAAAPLPPPRPLPASRCRARLFRSPPAAWPPGTCSSREARGSRSCRGASAAATAPASAAAANAVGGSDRGRREPWRWGWGSRRCVPLHWPGPRCCRSCCRSGSRSGASRSALLLLLRRRRLRRAARGGGWGEGRPGEGKGRGLPSQARPGAAGQGGETGRADEEAARPESPGRGAL